MIKISLAALGFFFSILSSFAQVTEPDTSSYTKRKLQLEEINFVTSYYSQNGDNSAVTGGIGTEKLTDNSNLLELKFVKQDIRKRTRALNFQLGVDAYTSASSDRIDPATISSASRSDRRIYPSVSYSVKNDVRRYAAGINGYFSSEYDYTSFGTGVNLTKISKDGSKDITLKLQVFLDKWKIILPIELRNVPGAFISNSNRNSFNTSLIYTSVINKRMHFAALADLAFQSGLLSTPFNRVYFTNNDVNVERLPDNRFKIPLGFRLNYFLGDRIILRSFYRFYYDSWNLFANTLSLEAPVKITPLFSVAPVYRFYVQTAADYFAPFMEHRPTEQFYTSDYDLSAFTSHLVGVNFRKVSPDGILGIRKWNLLEARYAYYFRSNGLSAHSIALAFRFK